MNLQFSISSRLNGLVRPHDLRFPSSVLEFQKCFLAPRVYLGAEVYSKHSVTKPSLQSQLSISQNISYHVFDFVFIMVILFLLTDNSNTKITCGSILVMYFSPGPYFLILVYESLDSFIFLWQFLWVLFCQTIILPIGSFDLVKTYFSVWNGWFVLIFHLVSESL